MGKYFDILAYLMGKLARGGGGGGGDITVESKSISANGTYTAPSNKAYSPVTVNVPNSYAAGDEGKVVSNGALVAQSSDSVTENGTVDTTLINSLTVNVSGGGGVTQAPPKQVNFVDYDGTILYSYTAQEANALSALPANPSHTGLTAQGWNWSLAEIKAQLTAMPDAPVWVGQMYITASGDTEIDVRFADAARLSPILNIAVNGTVTVDWGDGTAADTVTGSSLTTQQAVPHTYSAIGDYTIKIHVTSGSFTFYGSSSYLILRKNTTGNENRVYANCVQAVRFGSGVTSIGSYAFYGCYSLAYVTIPSAVTSINTYAFYECYSLVSIAIPSTVTSISAYEFQYCASLASISIPSAVTSIGERAFQNCYGLSSITIPSNATSIAANVFFGCNSLASVSIPSSVTSIGNSAFSNCYGMKEYHVKPTSPPTLGTTVFNNIVSDCVIYVPSAKVTAYKGATGWSAYASYIQGE